MKYIPSALLTLCLLAGLTACAGTPAEQAPEETAWTVRQMAASIWEAGSSLGGTELLPGDDLYDTYVAGSYGLDAAEIADGAIWAAGGTSAQETAVFQTAVPEVSMGIPPASRHWETKFWQLPPE